MRISISRIPDDALVIRGGRNQTRDIQRGTSRHPAGIIGVSVECAEGVPVAELAQTIPHRQVGITTVAEVRKAGGDVARTTGRSPYHATLTGLTPEQVSKLLTPTVPNPGKEQTK
ncbi:MAG: flavoredoxin [Candidatus Poribacteria bacterium]|nr:flavoredoxin [Candidatus Poribacteria bacterium]